MRIYPDKTVDEEFKALGDAGHTGTLNDRQFSFLRGQGLSNSLTDMFFRYSGAAATLTVATTGDAGEIIFDPIAPLDQWTATTGDAGEIIFEEAA